MYTDCSANRAEHFDVTTNTILDSQMLPIHFQQIEEAILLKLNQGEPSDTMQCLLSMY